MDIKDFIAPFAVWKRAFEKPFTVKKPIDERPGAPRYRGFHINDAQKCIGCGTCEAICMNKAIDLVPAAGYAAKEGDSGLRPRVDYGRCCWCALCVDVCPSGSLGMSNEYVWIDSDPEVFRYTPGVEAKPWDGSPLGYRRAEGYRLLEEQRVEMPELDYKEAVQTFLELVRGYSRQQAEKEADRCVSCGVCIASCPAHMDIPGYINAVREGDMQNGLRLLYETNPFPEACGRICTHRCEEACAIGTGGDPVAIRWLKRYIADQVELADYGKVLPRAEADSGKKIAVVGAGPGGLSAAYYLALLGHSVTVFEKDSEAGGMLRYGIPEYRLPYPALDKDIGYIESLGVKIERGTAVGSAVALAELRSRFDAVYLSTGLPAAYSLEVPGDKHPRVLDGVAVLAAATRGEPLGLGKRVAVVGGGNVAMDAARTALRNGAAVDILYRRRKEDMPADPDEIREAIAEGASLVEKAIPLEVRDAAGAIAGKQALFVWNEARMVQKEDGKRPVPEAIPGAVHEDPYDSIIAAIGQGPDLSFIGEADRLELRRFKPVVDGFGRIAEAAAGAAAEPGAPASASPSKAAAVFAGGDLVNDRKDAISAIADGHHAAQGIDRWLDRKGS
ncbi:MAG: FAD-dependent oxidoreductase [Spirochaetes bacterium]|nr:FAD-dependent oxidoreductase [Spirochaetota bacterium]MBU0957045.1 FAD-dependent oxidoreductase [Spirochaetota bacterium]